MESAPSAEAVLRRSSELQAFVGGPEVYPGASAARRQHLAALLANLASVSGGIAMGWTAPALPLLQSEAAPLPLPLSPSQGSWLSALVSLGTVLGALPAGLLADRLGRKPVLLGLAAPCLVGWLLVLLARYGVWLLYGGRLLTGMALGAALVLVPVYCEEIAHVSVRGALGSYVDLMLCVGFLWIYSLGPLVPYAWYTASALLVPAAFFIGFVAMPESPVFLAASGRSGDARKALLWLRGGRGVDLELQGILASIGNNAASALRPVSSWRYQDVIYSTTFRALMIVLGLLALQQLSGINAVLFYAVQIFEQAGSSVSPELSTIILGVVQLLSVLCASLTVDRLGRRLLLLLSAAGMAACLAVLSVYSYCDRSGYDVGSWRWLPLASLVMYDVVFSLGFGPLPWLLMAELMPDSAKRWATPAAVVVYGAFSLVLVKIFPLMLEDHGQDFTYGVLSGFCVIGGVFAGFLVPETKGKTKEDIMKALGGVR